jgi:hypothetical protein
VGDKPLDLQVCVLTDNGDYGGWVAVCSHKGTEPAFPKGTTPVVEVEYPSKAPDAAPIKKRYTLDQFC